MSAIGDKYIDLMNSTAATCTDERWKRLKAIREQEAALEGKVLIAQEWWDFCDHFSPDALPAAELEVDTALRTLSAFKSVTAHNFNEIYHG